jgi:pimeloyl-ACP methyl ester carboxylesterase
VNVANRTPPRPASYVGRNGVDIVADAYGDPQAPAVVLLHGGGQTRHAWGSTARALGAAGWHALALDLRGHGDSDWDPRGDYSLDAFVDDLLAVVAALGRAPVLVGASLGGLASLLAAGEIAPRSFRAVVVVDVAPKTEPEGVERIVSFMGANPDGFASVEEAADAVARYLPHRPRPASLEGLRKNLRLRADGRYRWHWDPAFMHGERRVQASRDPDRLTRAARGLRVPTLLVRGRMSDVVSEEGARHFIELVPHARYVDVSGAGHMVAGDENDAFTDAVIEFLEGLES